MNIDRHNYEEYFILYMDNELSSDERRMVEAFVQQHPDLKDELDILFQYKLEPDTTISFTSKEELLKADTVIPIAEQEEQLLLYIDNELSSSQKKTVEQLIASNSGVKKELALLQKSKLQPETIVFADKASLYKKEEKVRALPVRWWRAAAAVLLFAIGLTALFITNKPSWNKEEVAVKENVETPKNALVNTEQSDVKVNPVAAVKDDNNNANETTAGIIEKNKKTSDPYKQANNSVAIAPDKVNPDKIIKPVVAPEKNDMSVMATNNIPSNNLPQPEYNPNIKKEAAKMATANVNAPVKQSLTDNAVTSTNDKPSDIVQAAVIDDGAFTQSGSKKNKLRGLFRKVTRTFEKRTNTEAADGEGKLLVAGLAFNRN
jgi:hypothetical protein